MATKNKQVEQLKEMLPQYLDILGVSTKGSFKCLNPNHIDKTPSMSFDAKDGRHVHCFGCDATWDIFDLIAVNELKSPVIDGPDGKPKVKYNFPEAYNKALQVLNVDDMPMAQSEHKQPENERESQLRAKVDKVNARVVKNASELLSTSAFNQKKDPTPEQRQSHELGLKYLQKRGLSLEIAERFKVGFSSNWASPTAILKGHKPQGTPRLIIPTGPFSYIARDSRDSIPEGEQSYKKMKEGPVHIFNEEALSKNQPIFIVEGEIDAMSIMETGKAEAIGLGSVANINLFMKALYKAKNKAKAEQRDFYPTLLVALDNDDAGNRAINRLTTQLNRANVTNYVVQIARGSKDANEALVKDRAQFTKDIENTLKDPDNRLQGLLDYINRNEEVEAIPTGFSNLDKVLDGGLYEGLYGIGAISSLGKTTFALQIADYIAQYDKKPVLYFALEMGTYELMTKSISRITFENAQGEETLAQGTRSLLKGKWKQRYNKAQYANVMQSFKEYGDFYSDVIIHDGSEARPTIYDISETVNSYVARTGNKPVVIIDYLQILKPTNERGTDKANVTTSVNEMKKIATRYHIPVIVISSFNRLNYNSPVSMEAFKESGDIEYSTDVLIGLQLKGVGTNDFDVNEAKRRMPRNVEAVILKNRNGATGNTLQYAYYSMFNKFLDMDSMEEPERQPQEARTQVDDEGRVFSSTKEYREYLDQE
ncbi:DnaB-like helicase C-terminal domain-containing protein [Limosilactobacillus reuteri]|uniref:DnaB-like helicase C-terminal domain-containing protein n=1 Tax=Limosilactobacillus reuteri TaxID=1598 RepID=UPI003D065C03